MVTWQYGYSWEGLGEYRPIAPEMGRRLTNTIFLLGIAFARTLAVGLPSGIFAGSRRGRKIDVSVIRVGLLTYGMLAYLIQMLFLLFFSYYSIAWFGVQIIPFGGIMSEVEFSNPILLVGDIMWHSIDQ
ncbi:MAG: hypothetical protein JSV05_00460 [Candidatus Bathyarchaeota archaeon]|nr:MAG: hypothetical protein JSV05_00460 [Candidatus Bathyarchaeota archaeon]